MLYLRRAAPSHPWLLHPLTTPTPPRVGVLSFRWVMSMRVCAEPGCPELQPESRCPAHRREREQRRGSRQQRGYGPKHQALRTRWLPRVASGKVMCWSCGTRISPLHEWHLGHCEDDRSVTHGPEHPLCNERHKGQACPHPTHQTQQAPPPHGGVTPLGPRAGNRGEGL